MLERLKAKILFEKLLKRPNIDNAYKMVSENDSWYSTIKTVHDSLAQITKKPHRVIEITSHDNLKLKGIYYPADGGSDTTVICAHGYTSHAEREWAFPGLYYLSLGYNVLIPYQRAHGLSEGKYITFGALEHIDMADWAKKVNELTPNGKIVMHGLSMGGGILLYLSKIGVPNLKCLIVDAPSVSINDFFTNVSKEVFKRGYEAVATCAKKRFNKTFLANTDDFEALEIIKECKYPMLLSAGSEEHLDGLFDVIKNNNPMPTDTIILPGCNHGNGMYKQTALYQSTIKAFLDKNLN